MGTMTKRAKKPADPAPNLSASELAFIESGGAPAAKADPQAPTKTKSTVPLLIRVPADVLEKIDQRLANAVDSISRNAWIVGAVRLRLQSEDDVSKDAGDAD
jgi:hypothetical protein